MAKQATTHSVISVHPTGWLLSIWHSILTVAQLLAAIGNGDNIELSTLACKLAQGNLTLGIACLTRLLQR